MGQVSKCPQCQSENIYCLNELWICPECGHEWSVHEAQSGETQNEGTGVENTEVRDAHGNVLVSGDTVVVIKDLKIKGASSVVKGGTKVKNIRLIEEADGHNISCRIEGFGAMNLKSEFVKKL